MSNLKITEEIMEDYGIDEVFNLLEDKIKETIDDLVTEHKRSLILSLTRTESPIERLMILGLQQVDLCTLEGPFNVDIVDITPQYEIKCGDSKYRVDICIPVYLNNIKDGKLFIIECDGHDFHEKTKNQVKKDNKRHRDLLAAGHIVIKFSGSEIYESPYGCASQVKVIIREYCKKQLDK